ncbi:Hypothetical predicted protein [Xyrichtys novacula]|uniref:Uncharacterized protein n=1 Tax=Xyrichtys novacula TaxID=13765 RepID=A0AAV1FUI2_XYRNO|nr:Hypothetical predicted protein [Xyrichtys novacula]
MPKSLYCRSTSGQYPKHTDSTKTKLHIHVLTHNVPEITISSLILTQELEINTRPHTCILTPVFLCSCTVNASQLTI